MVVCAYTRDLRFNSQDQKNKTHELQREHSVGLRQAAQSVNCLTHKNLDPNVNSRIYIKVPVTVVPSSNPSSGEEADELLWMVSHSASLA